MPQSVLMCEISPPALKWYMVPTDAGYCFTSFFNLSTASSVHVYFPCLHGVIQCDSETLKSQLYVAFA